LTYVLEGTQPDLEALDEALAGIAAEAAGRDAEPLPLFPEAAFARLERSGATSWNALPGSQRPPARAELDLVRRVAKADGSVGRIFDGHLNAVERIAVQGPPELRDRELAAFAAGEIRGGVWGGDPGPGEGDPATVLGGRVLRGVKTFCSGAGGLHRALVIARDERGGPPVSVWIDLTDERAVQIDETWYQAHGLRASVSHRVVFHDAPVMAQLGPPGAISTQPWFARDALRTAASWVGMADTAVESALRELAARPARGEVEALAAGRILTAHRTLGVWLAAGAEAMDRPGDDLAAVALHARAAIYDSCRTLLDEAARACGSRPFARAGALDRARRDLELFLLQHRLDPMLARAGAAALDDLAGS
jgi:alkylation response protein AidB-like acyl-CoA dehydrogenase